MIKETIYEDDNIHLDEVIEVVYVDDFGKYVPTYDMSIIGRIKTEIIDKNKMKLEYIHKIDKSTNPALKRLHEYENLGYTPEELKDKLETLEILQERDFLDVDEN